MRLKGKVAIVTGGTSGIGRRMVERFVEEGASVFFSGRRAELGAEVAKATGATFIKADVALEADAARTIATAAKLNGRVDVLAGGPHREGEEPKPMMHGLEKSDLAVVAMKPANKAGAPAAERVEPRAGTKGNADPPRTRRTQSRGSVSQGLERVRQAARQRKRQAFTALLHHVTVDALRDAFLALERRAAPGVDGMTWQDYESGLEDHLLDLHARVHRGTYRALPVRRRFIPKPDGRQRPLGIAALEDKIVQRAVVTVLNAIYEEDFLGFSYGFRPGRGQHNALDALCVAIKGKRVNWVLDADIKGFFDAVDHVVVALREAPRRRRAHQPAGGQVARGRGPGRRAMARQ